jgi:flagellar hook assembly protein FlgD
VATITNSAAAVVASAEGTGSGSIVVDTAGPDVSAISPDGSSVGVFTPNGDGTTDTVTTAVTVPEAGSLYIRVADTAGATIRTWTAAAVAGPNTVVWDGKNNAGALVADGDYRLNFVPSDGAGNKGLGKSRPVRVIRFLSAVKSSAKVFYPQDNDRFAPTTSLSFAVSKPVTASWTIRNAAGAVVATKLTDAAIPAGTQTWVWNGRRTDGTALPLGVYTATVTATDGALSISQSVKVEMNAFAVVTSTSTPKRGAKMTVTVTSAEALSTSVRLYVTQPGLAMWAVTMTKVDSRVSKATITLKTGGSAGKVTLKVWARDYDGISQATTRILPLS